MHFNEFKNEMTCDSLSNEGEDKNFTELEDMCWVCENWIEGCFGINLPDLISNPVYSDDPLIPTNVFIHFDFDNWEPDLMEDIGFKLGENHKGRFN